MTLENLLRTLNNYHKRHGITILYKDSETVWVRIKNFWLKISTGVYVLITYLASYETLSNNGPEFRMLNLLAVMSEVEMLSNECLFWMKRKKVLELVDWCRRAEVQKFDSFNKPIDWFEKKRNTIHLIIRFVAINFMLLFITVVFIGVIVQTYLYKDGYHLTMSYDFKNFSERDSIPIFLTEFIILGSGCWFFAAIFYFSFSFFVLFSNYVVGQLELVQHYIKQLELNDPRKLRYQLRDLVKMHLDVLRTIKKISSIYLYTLKAKELSLYVYVALIVFGKDLMSLVIPPAIASLVLVVGLYCYACENVMDAEEDIRNAYYELDWYEAPVASRKLLLLAMQKPEEIRFGRVFCSDYASMERFLVLVRRGYDFSLGLLSISKQ